MEKIFYAKQDEYPNSEAFIKRVLRERLDIRYPEIVRGETGKPYLVNGDLHFSLAHTNGMLFLAAADKTVGLDAESISRKTNYVAIVKRYADAERLEIRSDEDFLRHWTARESAVKWLGGSLARDMRSIRFEKGVLYYRDTVFPVPLSFQRFEEYLLAVCCERDFSKTVPERFR